MAVFTKLAATLLRTAQVLGTLYAVGVCTYFIVNLAKRDAWNGRTLAVEIISAAGFLWATFVLILTVCLLQKSFFQFFTMFIDLLFVGGFVAIIVLIRNAWRSDCNANAVAIPWLERGGPNLKANCKLTKGLFIVSIILALLFLLTTIIACIAHRSTKKDKAYGPSPSNNYTSGRGKKHNKHDTEAGRTSPAHVTPVVAAVAGRRSHDSKYTDVTEKTNDGGLHGTTANTSAGREYLAPRAGYTGNDRTVSPVPSNTNLHGAQNSHAGQYAMAGALVGGTAAHHHNNKTHAYGQTDTLPNHPGPQDGTTERVYSSDAEKLGGAGAYGRETYTHPGNTNSVYSELDNTTTTSHTYATPTYTTTGANSSFVTPAAYPTTSVRQPNAYYPAAQAPNELDSVNSNNPHYYNTDLHNNTGNNTYTNYNATGNTHLTSELPSDEDKRYSEYLSPVTPSVDERREEEGFGYGTGSGMHGGGGNQVSTLPELGREDNRRF